MNITRNKETAAADPRHTALVPDAAQVAALSVGDLAIDCFGKLREVVEINYRGTDLNGKTFVGYSTEFGPHSSITASMKDGEIVATAALTGQYKSVEIWEAQRRINNGTAVFID